MSHYEITASHEGGRKILTKSVDQKHLIDFEGKEGIKGAESFLGSLAACKLVTIYDLKEKYEMTFQKAEVQVSCETKTVKPRAGQRQPYSIIESITYAFYFQSEESKEELEAFLAHVNEACTLGNSISENITVNYTIEVEK